MDEFFVEVRVYQTKSGKRPFLDWLNSFQSKIFRQRVWTRLDRVYRGNFGDTKPLGSGLYELRLHFDSGIRIYLGKRGDQRICVLLGGDKGTQRFDIDKAKSYWSDYLRNNL